MQLRRNVVMKRLVLKRAALLKEVGNDSILDPSNFVSILYITRVDIAKKKYKPLIGLIARKNLSLIGQFVLSRRGAIKY